MTRYTCPQGPFLGHLRRCQGAEALPSRAAQDAASINERGVNMASQGNRHRVIALVGPQSSGKTSLLESILVQTGTLGAKGHHGAHTFGDASPEAKAREMGTEINIARTTFMDEPYTFIDCPGANELQQDARGILNGVDAAIVVTEHDSSKIISLAPLLKYLELHKIPHYIFVNKIDRAGGSVADLADALNLVTGEAVVLRQIPIYDGENVTGYVDLASERAYVYNKEAPSEISDTPGDLKDVIEQTRYTMLETLADFDEHLMEELLEDKTPPKEEIYQDLTDDLAKDLIIPVLMGSALNDNGVHRLLKALRHEVPTVEAAVERLGVESGASETLAQVLKTFHTGHGGKLSITRIFSGQIKDGDTFNGNRVAGVFHVHGDKNEKCAVAEAGDLVGLGRLEGIATGDTLTGAKPGATELPKPEVMSPVYNLALHVTNRSDEAKLSTSLAKACDEDPSLIFDHSQETNESLLRGQGDVHIQIALQKLESKYGIKAQTERPQVPYKETIRKGTTQHSRYKKQSGGHGQFGDVVIDVKPLPAGTGFTFNQTITGGDVPKQYIPSVEAGIKEYLQVGPLGFEVVDVGVTLTDGSYHAVDSSDMAFKSAGRMAMSEAMPNCSPVLLEPIMHVHFMVPSEFTSKVNGLISGRRGQILGFDAREGWSGWDDVEAYLPHAEIQDIIIELRSMTLGSGTFTYKFDHLSELTGRLADNVLNAAKAAE